MSGLLKFYYSLFIFAIVIHVVILYILDWQRALSVLWKTYALTNKQVETSVYRKEAVIRNKVEASRVLERSLLDVVLSVAASVTFSLLLISGDVEENPGPGGNNILLLIIVDCMLLYMYTHRS